MNLVEQITDAIKGVIQTELPTYQEIDFKYDIARNDFKGNKKRFGVTPAAGVKANSVTSKMTINQTFLVTLTQDFVSSDINDDDLNAQIMELSDKFDELATALHAKKAGLSSIVLLIDFDSIEQAEILDDNNVVALRVNFTVRYRNNIK